jgi:hypothetical protein
MATGQLLSLDAESECIEFCAGHAPVILAARRLSDNLNCKALGGQKLYPSTYYFSLGFSYQKRKKMF